MIRGLMLTDVILGLLLAGAGHYILELRDALAAKPKIEYREKIVERKVQVRVAGPVRVEEHIVQAPGGEKVIERVVYRDVVKTETDSNRDSSKELEQTPACPPAPRSKRFLAAIQWGPDGSAIPIGGRAGVNLLDRVDLSAGYIKGDGGHDRVFADAAWRFNGPF